MYTDGTPATTSAGPGHAADDGAVSAVVFDLGGVLLDWDPSYVLDPADVEALDIDGVQRQLDLGVPPERVRGRWHARYPDRRDAVDRYFDNWHHTLPGPIDETVAVLDELHSAGVGLFALSNFSGDLFREHRDRFEFLDRFDGMVISGDEQIVKPDPAIYTLLLDRFGLEPATTVFVDDRQDNVAGARAVGMLAVLFRSAAGLRDELRRMGVFGS